MADIHWTPERPKDGDLATRVEETVHATIGRMATGTVTLTVEDGPVIHVPPTRLVPAPSVWDTVGEPVRVDDGIVQALRMAGIRAR